MKKNKVMVSIRIHPDVLKGIDKLAKKQNRTRTNCIENILINAVESRYGTTPLLNDAFVEELAEKINAAVQDKEARLPRKEVSPN